MREINYVKLKYGPLYENGWLIANFVRLCVGIQRRCCLCCCLAARPAFLHTPWPAMRYLELRHDWQPTALHTRKVTVFWANGLPNAAALTELQGLQLPSYC